MKKTIAYTAIVLTLSLLSCAHKVKKVEAPQADPVTLSATATVADEMSIQKNMMGTAITNQVDVLAPIHFNEANRFYTQAKNDDQKGSSSEQILNSISYSRGHLNKAIEQAAAIKPTLDEITNARNQAIKAGARHFPAKLSVLDEELKHYTAATNVSIPQERKITFQDQYLALELSTIKTEKLIEVQELLTNARVKGAETTTPTAYAEAVSKYNIADKLIETDRHNNDKINAAVTIAQTAATRVMTLLSSEQASRNQTPEQRAMTLEARDNALKQADSDITRASALSMKKSEQLAVQGEALAFVQGERASLMKKENEDKMVNAAAAKFTENEADVYRQDGRLIIRLKSMNFASGRSDLPSESLLVLAKVKEVIRDVGPGQVTVQGHTDAVGAAKINQTLSQSRAEAVAKFFSVDEDLEKNKFDSVGYGYSKPLATNKTKEGRAQNRRVDVVIETSTQL